jgi:hypothetical protein
MIQIFQSLIACVSQGQQVGSVIFDRQTLALEASGRTGGDVRLVGLAPAMAGKRNVV